MKTEIRADRFFRLSLTQAQKMMAFIHAEIILNKQKCEADEFFFEVELPNEFAGCWSLFARVEVGCGDVYIVTFHQYPNKVLI